MPRIVTAAFASRDAADRAAEALRALGLSPRHLWLQDGGGVAGPAPDTPGPAHALLDALPSPERAAHAAALRNGATLLSAEVAAADAELALRALDVAGAISLDAPAGSTGGDIAGAPDAGGAADRPRCLARREPWNGRARRYVIDAPPAGPPDPSG